jgi:hypothetical protein
MVNDNQGKGICMNAFDKWLFEIPWRFERYYNLVPGLSEQDKLKLNKEYAVTQTTL